jgi:hypothetical protein
MKLKIKSKQKPKVIKVSNEALSVIEGVKTRKLEDRKPFSKIDTDYRELKGLCKKEIIFHMGLMYNDLHSDVWMFRITDKIRLFKKNYLYLHFKKNKVHMIQLKRFKFS